MLTIKVKDANIRGGKRGNPEQCAIACAIREAVPGAYAVQVNDEARWRTPGGKFIAQLPDVALDFIDQFDDGLEVAPFAFECEPARYQWGGRIERGE